MTTIHWPKHNGIPRTIAPDGGAVIYEIATTASGRTIRLRVERDGWAEVTINTVPCRLAWFRTDGTTQSVDSANEDTRALWNLLAPKVRPLWRDCCAAIREAYGEKEPTP